MATKAARITIDPIKFEELLKEHGIQFREMLRDVALAYGLADRRFYPLNKIVKQNLTTISVMHAKLLLQTLVPHTPLSLEEIRGFMTFDTVLEKYVNERWTPENMSAINADGLNYINRAKLRRMKETLTSYIFAYDDIIKRPCSVIKKINQLLDDAVEGI